VTALLFESYYLGQRTLRRFYRVPANPISVVLYPLIQLFVFSQLFKDIVQLPGFGGGTSYLAYLAPGQITFTVFFAVSWSGGNLPWTTGTVTSTSCGSPRSIATRS